MRHPPECLWLLESTYTEKAQKKVLVWTDVNEASRIKCFESSGKVEKHCTRTRPFYFLHIVAGSELDVFFSGVYTLWRTHHKEFKQNEFYFGIGPQTWTFQQIMFHWNQTDKKKHTFFADDDVTENQLHSFNSWNCFIWKIPSVSMIFFRMHLVSHIRVSSRVIHPEVSFLWCSSVFHSQKKKKQRAFQHSLSPLV